MNYQRTLLTGVASVAAVVLMPGAMVAQQEEASKAVVEELEKLRPTLDLGKFQVKDFRPTRNETIKLEFYMHLALKESTSEHTVEQLEYWKHRLRNQVLIAFRLAERQDFLDADLHRFRRIVQTRINRVLKTPLIDEVLLTEFTFTTN
ncbi:MAG: hypothetical protein GXP26_06225 [Planctomycetes bacterium]|nr:hypothetical protein [Planctomycetota bacterium]